ncbi:MAG: hypothetical protein GX675_02150 [Erysipelotrichaceae bacterium]|nr:hypothetical protein [Erysipelotrichaceae bacterium]
MIDNLHIKSALNNASKKISMDDTVAKETLFNVLKEANMSTNVIFTPVIGAALISKPKINTTNVIAATTAGASIVALANYNPTIKYINYDQTITNKPVEILIDLSTSTGIQEIYAQNTNGSIYYGYKNNNIYVIEIEENGNYDVVVVSDSGNKDKKKIEVSNIDKFGPTIESYSLDNNIWSFSYMDEMSEIDFESAYALVDGNKIVYSTIDYATNTVSYEVETEIINVFISDSLGNVSNYLIEKK